MSNEIDPIQYGKLIAQVQNLEHKDVKHEKQRDTFGGKQSII